MDRYDLLILDVTLPDGTGFEVCEKVRKQNVQIPIIFLTASDEEISHQLKTPLAALMMYQEIIETEPDNVDTVREFSKKILFCAGVSGKRY